MSDAAPRQHSVSIFKQAMSHTTSVVHGVEQAIQQEAIHQDCKSSRTLSAS